MKKLLLLVVIILSVTSVACQQKEIPEKGNQTTISSSNLYESILWDDDNVQRAILSTEEGMVLIDEEGIFLSNVYEELSEEDLKKHLELIRFKSDNKYGYLSSETGEIVIDAVYNYASSFNAKICFVGDGEKKWLIHKDGTKASELYFEEASEYESQERYARVMVNGKWGVVDTKAEIVLPFEYDSLNKLPYIHTVATGIKNGKAIIIYMKSDERWECLELKQYIDITEINQGYWAAVTDSDGKAGIVDMKGNTVLVPKYKAIANWNWYGEDEFIVTMEEGFGGKYGAVYLKRSENSEMKAYTLFPAIYDNELDFTSKGIAVAYKGGIPGTIDIVTREWKELPVNKVDSYKMDMARVELNNQYGYLDEKGKFATKSDEFVYAEEFKLGNPYTVIGDGKAKGLVDSKFNNLLPVEYDEIYTFKDSDYVLTKKDEKYSIWYLKKIDDTYYNLEPIVVIDNIQKVRNNKIDNTDCMVKIEGKWYAISMCMDIIKRKMVINEGECSRFYTIYVD